MYKLNVLQMNQNTHALFCTSEKTSRQLLASEAWSHSPFFIIVLGPNLTPLASTASPSVELNSNL